jgi:hypothetical protein
MKKITFLVTFLASALFANAYDLTYTYDEATLTAVVTACSDNTITAVEIPATVTYAAKEYAVVGIGTQAFLNFSALASLTIPNSVTRIGKEAFLGTAWDNSQPANGLAYVGKCAYKYRVSYAGSNVTLVEGTVGIADECFMGKSYLYTVTMPTSLTHIGMDAFNGCTRMTSADIPTSVTTIGARAFQGCGYLTSANISNVTSIEEYAFAYCNGITSLTLSTELTTIGNNAFENCWGLTSLNIPTSVTSIGDIAFKRCSSLIALTIPEGVTTLGYQAFSGCAALTELSLPSTLTSISLFGFDGCTALTKITVNATTPPNIQANTFRGVTNTIPLYVPVGAETAYGAADYWKDFTSIAPIPVAIQPITVIDGVYARDGKISIENKANLPISIYDAAGRLVTQTSTSLTDYSVPQAGVYIVKVGSEVMKVVVN